MKKILLTTALCVLAAPSFAAEYTIRGISDPAGEKPYYFEPSDLTVQPGDTVTFVNAQNDAHDVMFFTVPKAAEDMIMSPTLAKEGEKWSYTFTVPGTYSFHCHVHEAAGMKGTIIVGQASAPDDMKTVSHETMEHHMMGMDHGDGHADHAGSAAPSGTGKINSLDAEKHTANITHEPIAVLQWPTMTMDFPVAADVDLSAFKAGDEVSFTLKAGENNQYSVATLKRAGDGVDQGGLRPVEAQLVCMMNNKVFDKPQIPVEVDGKTYYGCCPMCAQKLQNDAALRAGTDPVSGKSVDKATAVIGADASGVVYYFENAENMSKFSAPPAAAQ